MSTIDEIIADFKEFSSEEKLEVLLEYSENLPALPEKYHAERDLGIKRIHECLTPVHMWVEIVNNKVFIFVDIPRESPTVRGFVSLLIEAFHDKNFEEALSCPNNLLHSLGLVQVLGMTRLNGLSWITQRLKREITQQLGKSNEV